MDVREIIDGGLATSLIKNGEKGIDDDPLWSARLLHTNPRSIYRAHKRFSDSGASILISASYQASITGFKDHLNVNEEEGGHMTESEC